MSSFCKNVGSAIGVRCRYSGRKGMRIYAGFYDYLKQVCGFAFSGVVSFHTQDGQKLRANYKEILNQWLEYCSLLKCPSGISDEALNEVLQLPTEEQLAAK